MKNQREIYEALLAGEKVNCLDWGAEEYIVFKNDRIEDENGKRYTPEFDCFNDWQIYKEPKWYENIPDDGVLCWFGEEVYKSICIVFPVIPNEDFNSANYKPLTKQEIQVFLSNAPEDL